MAVRGCSLASDRPPISMTLVDLVQTQIWARAFCVCSPSSAGVPICSTHCLTTPGDKQALQSPPSLLLGLLSQVPSCPAPPLVWPFPIPATHWQLHPQSSRALTQKPTATLSRPQRKTSFLAPSLGFLHYPGSLPDPAIKMHLSPNSKLCQPPYCTGSLRCPEGKGQV